MYLMIKAAPRRPSTLMMICDRLGYRIDIYVEQFRNASPYLVVPDLSAV